jgi:AbrB family looped-hinge helix DNA binding protein
MGPVAISAHRWYSLGIKATIDKAGRLVIPKPLRERLGLRPGVVEVVADGAGIRIEPVAIESLEARRGRLVIPPSGALIDDDTVRSLRDGDQR